MISNSDKFVPVICSAIISYSTAGFPIKFSGICLLKLIPYSSTVYTLLLISISNGIGSSETAVAVPVTLPLLSLIVTVVVVFFVLKAAQIATPIVATPTIIVTTTVTISLVEGEFRLTGWKSELLISKTFLPFNFLKLVINYLTKLIVLDLIVYR